MLQNFHITNKLEGGDLMFWLVLVQKKIKMHISLTHDQHFINNLVKVDKPISPGTCLF